MDKLELKQTDTPNCKRCNGRMALISGNWYFTADQEPYLNGVIEEAERSEGEEWMRGYQCDDCGSVQDVWIDDDKATLQSYVYKLEAEIETLKKHLNTINQ